MISSLEALVDIIHSGTTESWKERNRQALAALFGTRYPKRAEDSVILRAPDMRGTESGVPYAAYVHPRNPESGAYAGMSFVVFPVDGERCLIGMLLGTQGLSPDEGIVGRPGHARKMQAICAWLNHEHGKGKQVAWAKQDPTRIDIDVPRPIQQAWCEYEAAFNKYGTVMYALYRPTPDKNATISAVAAMLDVMFEERGHLPLQAFQDDWQRIRAAWFSYLMPGATREQVLQLLKLRRYVVLQGPPGTGKTRMAGRILANEYAGFGRSIQFHPNTTYENFVGGLAPVNSDGEETAFLGFRFAPTSGFLMKAAAEAQRSDKPYLLHIDEINRADLGKILGEAIYLLETNADPPREIELAYDFGVPFRNKLKLPENLHILGTMNNADRSIAMLDIAIRRRFSFLSLWPSLQVVKEHGCELGQRAFSNLVAIFVEYAPDDALALVPGHSYFLGKDEGATKVNLHTSLTPLLTEYLAQGYVSGFAESVRGYIQWLGTL